MSEDTTITLSRAAREHLDVLEGDDVTSVQAEVERFVRWAGADRNLAQLTAHQVASYAETLTGSVPDAARRGDAVKKFLAFVNKVGYTSTNLGKHLRVKRASRKADNTRSAETIEMTEHDLASFVESLEVLKAKRPEIIEDIRLAMADKDFKENAPPDAAREQQGLNEGRIRKLEATINQAVIVEPSAGLKGNVVGLGSTVILRNLKADKEVSYTLVRPTETNVSQGRISFDSPVGRAVAGKRAGDEVEVEAPSGVILLRIERVGA